MKTLTMELRSAPLSEGYQIGLDSLAMDVPHSILDAIVTALGRPGSVTALGVAKDTAVSAAEVLFGYPTAIVRSSASALLPKADAAALDGGVGEHGLVAAAHPTEYTEQGSREVDLPTRDAYTAVIDHVLACCQGRDTSRLSLASVLDTLQLALEVRTALAAAKRNRPVRGWVQGSQPRRAKRGRSLRIAAC